MVPYLLIVNKMCVNTHIPLIDHNQKGLRIRHFKKPGASN